MFTWISDAGDCIQDQIQEYTKAHDLAESYKNYDEENGILSRDGKIFVLDDDNLQMEIVCLHCDMPLAGQPGQEKTLELLERSFFWSGHGTQFASQVMKDLCKHLRIIPKLSTAHHPQTNGQTEWMNCDLQQYLHIFTAEKQDEWADWITLAQFSYNTKKQSSILKSPFEVTHTYSPRIGIEKRSTKAPATDFLAEGISNTVP